VSNVPENRQKSDEFLYRLCRFIVVTFFRLMYHWRYVGYENIPASGPVILACNHIHNFDPFLVAAPAQRFIQFMAKEELFRFAPIGWIIRYLGAFPVRRGMSDKKALKTSLDITQNGGCLMIFPEGHRSKTGEIQQGQPGVAFIARKAQCAIVPIAIIGPYRFRKKLSVRVGKPFFPTDDDTNESLLAKLMENIRQLHEEGHVQ
jgi:1-acyl-sn-glycerol-3-phosphate acyltransferase